MKPGEDALKCGGLESGRRLTGSGGTNSRRPMGNPIMRNSDCRKEVQGGTTGGESIGKCTEVVEQPMGNPITRNADRRKEVRREADPSGMNQYCVWEYHGL
ncbi:hypothetical protein B0H12DRAFT_1076633 [Mycena haematopus]|nr:hypothetical protein B0H12DRAFT_1076633 [Mycena haematopus]